MFVPLTLSGVNTIYVGRAKKCSNVDGKVNSKTYQVFNFARYIYMCKAHSFLNDIVEKRKILPMNLYVYSC